MKFNIKEVKVRQERYSERKGEPYKYRNKMYIWPEGETVMENLMNRKDRPHTFYKKEVIPLIMKWLEENDKTTFEQLKGANWGWRQKCGCSCPCSPGFVSDKDGLGSINVTVEFK